MEYNNRQDQEINYPPVTYFDLYDPAYGPEKAYKEGIQIYIIPKYCIKIWPHDTGDGMFFRDAEWCYKYDIMFDTAFHDDHTWRKNVIERPFHLIHGDHDQPLVFNNHDPYEAESWERLFKSILNGKPKKRRYSFGAPALFHYGLKKVDEYRMEGNEMD